MKRLLIFAMLLLVAIPVAAQSDCGQGLPCGPIPWPVPVYPVLLTPTPIPTVAVTFVANPPDPTESPTPTATPTAFFDNGELEDSLATYQAVLNGTPIVVQNPEGTPVSSDDSINQVTANIGLVFGYLRGFGTLNLGWVGVLISFVITLFLAFLSIKVITILVPIFLAILGLFKRIYDVIMEFIPL